VNIKHTKVHFATINKLSRLYKYNGENVKGRIASSLQDIDEQESECDKR
jgi:hypothetical protein